MVFRAPIVDAASPLSKRYERNADRHDTRAGHCERKLQTKAGEVKWKVPRLRNLPFETEIIDCRRESSIEEALMEMYLAGVSVRCIEDISEAFWGTRVSPNARPPAFLGPFLSFFKALVSSRCPTTLIFRSCRQWSDSNYLHILDYVYISVTRKGTI